MAVGFLSNFLPVLVEFVKEKKEVRSKNVSLKKGLCKRGEEMENLEGKRRCSEQGLCFF
jgi:hypothetical protein